MLTSTRDSAQKLGYYGVLDPTLDARTADPAQTIQSEWMLAFRLIGGVALLAIGAPGDPSYRARIEQWREERQAGLTADAGWLSVAGLFWLRDGLNSVGSGASNDIVLPRGPEKTGAFDFRNGKTFFRPAPGVSTSLNGKPVQSAAVLRPDSEGKPDQLQLDGLTMFVIHRGHRYGIRLKDPQSKFRKAFTGLSWFPVNESYRIMAKFVPYNPPRMISIPNILGETEQEPSPGYVEFTLNGRALRLDPVLEDNQLFFIFQDTTSRRQTYPAGRFLYADLPKRGMAGEVELDFNKAQNPPCAFTPYATCPLPPKQNRLPVAIEAGELNYGHHEATP
jgi:uncharacterized protein (DUF1684 family)